MSAGRCPFVCRCGHFPRYFAATGAAGCGMTSESSCVMRSPVFHFAVQFGHDTVAHEFERRAVLLRDRFGRFLGDFQRIDRRAVFPDAVVEVGAGRGARRTDVADQLPLRNARALRDALGIAAQVQVTRHQVAGMFDFERVATAAAPALEGHYTVGYGMNGRAFRRRVIDARMRPVYLCRSDACAHR